MSERNSPRGASRQPVYRFAPSSNGLLHLGHAYSALTNLALARGAGGRMLLRIEDIDRQRCTPANEFRMLQDLEWIGFEWDEEPRRQSEHFDRYREVLDDLVAERLVYPATLSRREIGELVDRLAAEGKVWPRDPDGAPLYPGSERELDDEERECLIVGDTDFALRLDMKSALASIRTELSWTELGAGPEAESGMVIARPEMWGDVILGRRDIPASFHLCATLDDAWQGISNVVRGRDLFHSTAVHRLLQELLGLSVPEYHHHDLIVDDRGRKLSKSRGDTALRHLREAGLSRTDVLGMIGLGPGA